jgi:N-acetylneuraminate synthase
VASTNKPVLLSSGMSTWKELNDAVDILSARGSQICLMQCTSMYPCTPDRVGINIIHEMKSKFPNVVIGYSDHTLGHAAGVLAIAAGAKVIEKHFTYSKLMYGSDAKHSMEPQEFKLFNETLKEAWSIMANPVDKNLVAEKEMLTMKETFQKSIVLSTNLTKGHALSFSDLAFKKPGDGISAAEASKIVGKKLKASFPADYKLQFEDLE